MKPQPWNPADATLQINAMGRSDRLKLSWTDHCRQRLAERDLVMSDVLFVMKSGFVLDEPEPATQAGLYRYAMISRTPNSNNRNVRIVVIADAQTCWAKLVTIMWADEK